MQQHDWIIDAEDAVLITGAGGFIGARVVYTLLEYGFKNLRCFVRISSNLERLDQVLASQRERVKIIRGNLLSREDCECAVRGVKLIYHLAAGIDKSFAGAFMNSVVTTRNLLDATLEQKLLKRFVNVSSFAVYSTQKMKRGALLDESCDIEYPPYNRGEAYAYGKIKQDELVMDYGRQQAIPYVILRPGAVFGPGKKSLTGRVGINTFGFFLHLGGSIRIPLSYVDNCAEAIVLAGLVPGIEGEIFNIVDDDLPRSKDLLKQYKKQVRSFSSIRLPYRLTYFLCCLWEWYSRKSNGQLPPVFNRSRCSAEWKGNRYSNRKLKQLLGWQPRVPFPQALRLYFAYQRNDGE